MGDVRNVTNRNKRGRKAIGGVVTWVRLPAPTHARLSERACAESRPMSDLIRTAVERLLDEQAA